MTKPEKDTWFSRGFHFAWGAFCCIGLWLLLGTAASYLISGWWKLGVDDCDRDAWNRCGMTVHTDAKTGRQYLSTSGGGLVLRAPR